jgi:hypothetical protein
MLVFACDRDEPKNQFPEPTPSALGIDVSVTTDPARPAGDLKGDLDHFTTVEECMTKRTASMDPLVGDALGAIGYDTFLRDACRMLEAEKLVDATKCEGIDASSLRMRCRAQVAMIAGDADKCPMRSDAEPRFGRDPTCIAAAARSAAMCAGETRMRRPQCEALVTHDAKKCGAVIGADHDTCTRDAERFRDVLTGDAKIASVAKSVGELEIHGLGRDDPAETKVDLAPEIESGSVLVVGTKEGRYDVGQPGFASAAAKSVGPQTRTRLALTVHVDAAGDGKLDRLELAVPGSVALACDAASKIGAGACDVKLKQTKLDKTRGGAIELTIEGSIGAAPQSFAIKVKLATFVRDVVQR